MNFLDLLDNTIMNFLKLLDKTSKKLKKLEYYLLSFLLISLSQLTVLFIFKYNYNLYTPTEKIEAYINSLTVYDFVSLTIVIGLEDIVIFVFLTFFLFTRKKIKEISIKNIHKLKNLQEHKIKCSLIFALALSLLHQMNGLSYPYFVAKLCSGLFRARIFLDKGLIPAILFHIAYDYIIIGLYILLN
jgi:succinate dehydrogenase hydrophobic anchor subunit